MQRHSTCGGYPNQLLDFSFLAQQVGQGDARQQLIDALLEGLPDRPDAAGADGTTSSRFDRVRLAIDLECLMLGSRHHITNRDGFRQASQEITPLCPPHTLHQPGSPKPEQNLLDVVGRQALDVRKLTRGNGTAACPSALGQVNRDNQAVFGPGGDPHAGNMGLSQSGINQLLSAAVQRATSSALMFP
jgi:hypothetical protein